MAELFSIFHTFSQLHIILRGETESLRFTGELAAYACYYLLADEWNGWGMAMTSLAGQRAKNGFGYPHADLLTRILDLV
jgi:hypothetical protein